MDVNKHLILVLAILYPVFAEEACNKSQSLLEMISDNPIVSHFVDTAVSFLNSSLICQTVGRSDALKWLGGINIFLCNGADASDCEIRPLDRATELLNSSRWASDKETVMFVPGWTNPPTNEGYSLEVIKAYYSNGSYNLLVLDWYSVNKQTYSQVVALLPGACTRVATAIDQLATQDLYAKGRLKRLNIVGHSLGSHLGGCIGRSLKKIRISFLAALDPAGPLFSRSGWPCKKMVQATDADFVMSLHSDWGRFGINEPIGVVDYMANGGYATQPSCGPLDTNPCGSGFLCSHRTALHYWTSAIQRPGSVVARRCPSESAFKAGVCDHQHVQDITQYTHELGFYFFTTNSERPYGKGLAGV